MVPILPCGPTTGRFLWGDLVDSPYDKPTGGRWRFNPPPTWPQPPAGWEPWPGWHPPVQWPAAPPEWAYWVRQRRWAARHPVWTGAAAVFSLLVIIAAAAGDPQPAGPQPRLADAAATPAPTPSATASPTPSPTVAATPSATAAPTPSPTPRPAVTSAPKVAPVPTAASPYYANCAAVRAAGKAPLYRGQPGYRAGLDGDADGIACEVTGSAGGGSTGGGSTGGGAAPPVRTTPPPAPPAEVYYANCAAVRAAGKAPLYVGQPGYRAGLDRDGDGVACES